MGRHKGFVGWWKTHPYHRHSVEKDIALTGWLGWDWLKRLLDSCQHFHHRLLVLLTFKTGGRIGEVLPLGADNFLVKPEEKLITVVNMKVEKRYEKIDSYVDAQGRNRWHTKILDEQRTPFSFPLNELLNEDLLKVLEYRTPHKFFESYGKTGLLTPTRAWEVLHDELGLQMNMWLYNHFIRGQRASQLRTEYKFDNMDMQEWFSWEDSDSPLIYGRKGWRGLGDQMKQALEKTLLPKPQ